jgi:hypothetical protein
MARFTVVRYERDESGHLTRAADGSCTVAERKAFETGDWSDAMIRAMAAGSAWSVALVGHEGRAPYSEAVPETRKCHGGTLKLYPFKRIEETR